MQFILIEGDQLLNMDLIDRIELRRRHVPHPDAPGGVHIEQVAVCYTGNVPQQESAIVAQWLKDNAGNPDVFFVAKPQEPAAPTE